MNAPQRVDAFEKVYRTEHRRLLRKLRRRVGPDEAPDLVQEAFARLLGARDPERIENPAAYLSRITHNMLINRARKRQRGVPVFYPLDEERSEEHTSELQSLMRISYAVFCLKKKINRETRITKRQTTTLVLTVSLICKNE